MARRTLQQSKQKFMSGIPKKWFAMLLFFILGFIFLHPLLTKFYAQDFFENNRNELIKKLFADIFGPKTKVSEDLLTQDIFMHSYEIGNHKPYFFTRDLIKQDE